MRYEEILSIYCRPYKNFINHVFFFQRSGVCSPRVATIYERKTIALKHRDRINGGY